MLNPINTVELCEIPHKAWASCVRVHWKHTLGKRQKSLYLEQSVAELTDIDRKDWNYRYDSSFNVSYLYFRNSADAVSFYFYHT